jgi:hypothetical protein
MMGQLVKQAAKLVAHPFSVDGAFYVMQRRLTGAL